MMMRAFIVAAFLALAAAPVATPLVVLAETVTPPPEAPPADAKAARLDTLFAQLKAAPSPEEGKQLERQIVAEWLKSGDDETDALMYQAIVAMNVGALNKALALLDEIVARRPTYIEGWNKRATVYYMVKAFDKSLADIHETLKLEPRHFGALAGLGMIMMEMGDNRRALAAFEKAYEVDPTINDGKAVIEKLKKALGKNI